MSGKLPVTAVLLAAGSSRRMGSENKLLLPLGGKPMVVWVAEALERSCANELVVVLGHEAERVQEALRGYKFRFTYNAGYLEGMTSSIQAGIRAAAEGSLGWLICLGDMPWLEAGDYDRMLEAVSGGEEILVPVYEGRRGNPVFFSRHFRELLLAHSEPEGCRGVVLSHGGCVREVPFEHNRIFRDVDVPGDLRF